MIYLELFLGFLKVGCFSFGGAYMAIPLIRDIVMSYGWMSEDMLTYMIAVSESTPGPIMINLATYVGSSQAGIIGSAIATLGSILPAYLIIYLFVSVLSKIFENQYFKIALTGIKPCISGIIIGTGLFLTYRNITNIGTQDSLILNIIFAAIMFVIYILLKKLPKKKISPIWLIVISAFLGIIVFGI